MRKRSLAVLLFVSNLVWADDPTRILPAGQSPADARLTAKAKDLNGYFPFEPPASRELWEKRRTELREQLLVAVGLWPMPERPPIQATVHGKVEKDGYTVEKVFFASLPGHTVTGNLYRPLSAGKHPVVLCPHGHWNNGRLHDAGEKTAAADLKSGAETWLETARYFLQAKCAQLARMGCVVFHYDMIGYADSSSLIHRKGLQDVDAVLRLHSAMGMQTWNSVRSLDFVLALPDVDSTRVGVTGASGGGTQSFLLAAIDDRVTACFPAVMVSTAMQGGCVCENAPYLRVGTGNIEIAGLCAPRPLGMTGAKDWTIDIETKGFPQLNALYKLYKADDAVLAKCFPQFGHNYNQVSREVMYNWFNKHLKLGLPEPVKEKPFSAIRPELLSVFDADHPRPKGELDAEWLKKYLTQRDEGMLENLTPKDAVTLEQFRKIVGTALRVMVNDTLPDSEEVLPEDAGDRIEGKGWTGRKFWLARKETEERIPAFAVRGPKFAGDVLIWVHSKGKASLFQGDDISAEVQVALDAGYAVLAIDAVGTGELSKFRPNVDKNYAAFTYGYNRPFFSEQVHDILTAVAAARKHPLTQRVSMIGWGSMGPNVLAARALCGDSIGRTAVNLDGFRFSKVQSENDPRLLPGALKYGGLDGFAALCAPHALFVFNAKEANVERLVSAAYKSIGAEDKLKREPGMPQNRQVIDWVLGR